VALTGDQTGQDIADGLRLKGPLAASGPGDLGHVKDLTHFSSVPNALKLIAKKLEYYPVAETRLSACLLILLYSLKVSS
jgi:hypothetical protein